MQNMQSGGGVGERGLELRTSALMSTELLKEVQERTKSTNGTLKPKRCELNLQAYSHMGLQLKHVDPVHLTVGPMELVHSVYV